MKKRFVFLSVIIAFMACGVSCNKDLNNGGIDQRFKPVYNDYSFDFSSQIATEKAKAQLTPEYDLPLSAVDEYQASGVCLIPSIDKQKTNDFYLNGYVAGNKIIVTSKEKIKSVNGENLGQQGDVYSFSFTPRTLNLESLSDEVITVETEASVYTIHTLIETFPPMSISSPCVDDSNAGVYTFDNQKFLIRVNTKGDVVYYRNLSFLANNEISNFTVHQTNDGRYYTFCVSLSEEYHNPYGSFCLGMHVMMNGKYQDIDKRTLLPNDDKRHLHGEGYLDEHEFVIIGENHYLLLSYMPLSVSNLPENVKGVNGSKCAFVMACIIQEIRGNKVINEINTTDYPFLYENAVEGRDYENSTDKGGISPSDGKKYKVLGYADYSHTNSLDYTLGDDGNVDKLLVSMRDQSAIYLFDIRTGNILWSLGGKSSTFSGYDEHASVRADGTGGSFMALTFGQHCARFLNKDSNSRINGNPVISVFDNETGSGQMLLSSEIPNNTRMLEVELDLSGKSAKVTNVINGSDLNKLNDKYHIASHCGSYQNFNENSIVIGWGAHLLIGTIFDGAPYGTISDVGYPDLRFGSIPIYTEYDQAGNKITFELSTTKIQQSNSTFLFTYRTYKTAD